MSSFKCKIATAIIKTMYVFDRICSINEHGCGTAIPSAKAELVQNLASRPEIRGLHKTPQQLLKTLEANDDLVNKAKRWLLDTEQVQFRA